MEPLESYYEIQYNTHGESRCWKAIGDRYKTFTEATNMIEQLKSKQETSKLVKSFQVIKSNVYIDKETIKVYTV